MNNNTVLVSALAAGAVATAIYWFVKRRKKSQPALQQVPAKQSRHLTNVFAKAKQGID